MLLTNDSNHIPYASGDPVDEDALLAQARQGQSAAFNVLIRLYWDRIYARCYQLLRNHEDAAEVTQDTFARAYRGLENFRGEAAFYSWIYQIATNLSHNRTWYWIRRKRDLSHSLDASLGQPENEFSFSELLPSDDPNPRQELLALEWEQAIRDALPQLKASHQEILRLRLREDLSYEEIADRLELRLGTVKSRIARAREALREAVEASVGTIPQLEQERAQTG